MTGKSWGLHPKMSLWLYTTVVRPILTYGSVVWWTRTKLTAKATKESSLHKTGYTRTIPTATSEIALSIHAASVYTTGSSNVCFEA